MDNCPKCKANWLGDPIPERIKKHYSGTHWRREIGIDGGHMGLYDGLVAIRCPDCEEEFPWGQCPVALDMFKKYKEVVASSRAHSEEK